VSCNKAFSKSLEDKINKQLRKVKTHSKLIQKLVCWFQLKRKPNQKNNVQSMKYSLARHREGQKAAARRGLPTLKGGISKLNTQMNTINYATGVLLARAHVSSTGNCSC
jgi:hypothetical protein